MNDETFEGELEQVDFEHELEDSEDGLDYTDDIPTVELNRDDLDRRWRAIEEDYLK